MNEQKYIRKRLRIARLQSLAFYINRLLPIQKNKVVFCNIEGTVGYGCNPKYVCEELLRRNNSLSFDQKYDLVWLVDDDTKPFPKDVRVVKNTLWNRAKELSTAAIWVDNSRKQLECRKRKGQFYIQTWHANVAIKPIGLDRGKSFSKMAYLVSKHDSDMIDLVLTDSKWYEEKVVKSGLLYEGVVLRSGSPRVDVLLNERDEKRKTIREKYGLKPDTNILMYAPTFRGGSQETSRAIEKNNQMPDFDGLKKTLEKKFGGRWCIFLRLHPQLTARHISSGLGNENAYLIDVSKEDDMFETLAACDVFLSDYSASVFDASYMKIPVFLYVYDLKTYRDERGKLMWNLDKLPFPKAESDAELLEKIEQFDEEKYHVELGKLFKDMELKEDGTAALTVADVIEKYISN